MIPPQTTPPPWKNKLVKPTLHRGWQRIFAWHVIAPNWQRDMWLRPYQLHDVGQDIITDVWFAILTSTWCVIYQLDFRDMWTFFALEGYHLLKKRSINHGRPDTIFWSFFVVFLTSDVFDLHGSSWYYRSKQLWHQKQISDDFFF